MPIGIASIILLTVVVGLVIVLASVLIAVKALRKKAEQGGYASLGQYLRATPRTDEERQDAVDLALKGLVICIAGVVVPPVVFVGLPPLYYGARKLIHSSMGFGLVDDAETPDA
jgi:hypothetical protein